MARAHFATAIDDEDNTTTMLSGASKPPFEFLLPPQTANGVGRSVFTLRALRAHMQPQLRIAIVERLAGDKYRACWFIEAPYANALDTLADGDIIEMESAIDFDPTQNQQNSAQGPPLYAFHANTLPKSRRRKVKLANVGHEQVGLRLVAEASKYAVRLSDSNYAPIFDKRIGIKEEEKGMVGACNNLQRLLLTK